MEENFESYNENEDHTSSLNRFEQMLEKDESYFFDVDEFEKVIDYYLEESNTEKAKQAIQVSLHQHPSSSALKLKKAYYLAAIHQPNKALAILNSIELMEPFNVEIVSVKAGIHSQLRQHNKSIENFYKALKLTDDISEQTNIKINIAFEYENLNLFDKAIDILKKLLIENPKNETVIYELAFCYNLKNDSENCIAFFKEFVDIHPYSSAAWYNLGIAYNRAELYEKAIDAYDFTIAIKDSFASAYFNKGNSLALLHEYEKAITTYLETFNYEEPDSTTYYYIGECYEKLGDTKAAFISYYKSTRLDEFHADSWAGLSVISDGDSKFQSALYYIKKAIELERENSEFWYIHGDILSRIGMIDEALSSYQKVKELDPLNEDIWIDIAEVTKDYENIEKAIIILYEGLEKQPENYLIYARLVSYLLINGKQDEALQNLVILLTNKKEYLKDLIEYFPELISYPRVLDIIENFDKNNEF